jgi:hypothetical protein
MHRVAIALLLVSGTAAAKSYMDNKQTVAHDCTKDPVATIMGNENTVTLTGACTKITVNGNNNKITAASAKEVSVPGNENTVDVEATDNVVTAGSKNTVTWKKGVSDKKPAVHNSGTGNKVSQK